jgi:phage/plasmid-associated DNA primase
LIGKLLLNVVEAPADFFAQPGAEVVKALCGHDVMNAEKKGVNDPLDLVGLFPVILSSNEQLRVRLAGDEDSWIRRILIIDFLTARAADAEIIDNFEEFLVREEGEDIFAWMIEGAQRHWCELAAHKGFASTAEQQERVHNLIARSKSIEIFIQQNLLEDPEQNVTVNELYNAYATFCKNKAWKPVREQTFETESRHLVNQYWSVTLSHDIERREKAKRGYHGLALVGHANGPD